MKFNPLLRYGFESDDSGGSGASDHESLTGLLGGATGEHVHLTNNEYDYLRGQMPGYVRAMTGYVDDKLTTATDTGDPLGIPDYLCMLLPDGASPLIEIDSTLGVGANFPAGAILRLLNAQNSVVMKSKYGAFQSAGEITTLADEAAILADVAANPTHKQVYQATDTNFYYFHLGNEFDNDYFELYNKNGSWVVYNQNFLNWMNGQIAWDKIDTTTADYISNTLIDAKGDLIVGSAADTAAILAVGTNDYVLTADSAATNGVAWKAATGGAGRTLLTANKTYYVRTDGSNTNDGLSNTSGGAFLTIQKAVDVVNATLDTAGYTVTIQVADGTYTTPIIAKDILGGGKIIIQGNTGNKSAVIISTTSASCFSAGGPSNTASAISVYILQYLKLTTTTSGQCIDAQFDSCRVYFNSIDFGACAGAHIVAFSGAYVEPNGNYAITGGATSHINAQYGGIFYAFSKTVTITGTLSFTVFAAANFSGIMRCSGFTFSGGTVAGTRYSATSNGVINTAGGGANYFPGNVAGTTSTGGLYI